MRVRASRPPDHRRRRRALPGRRQHPTGSRSSLRQRARRQAASGADWQPELFSLRRRRPVVPPQTAPAAASAGLRHRRQSTSGRWSRSGALEMGQLEASPDWLGGGASDERAFRHQRESLAPEAPARPAAARAGDSGSGESTSRRRLCASRRRLTLITRQHARRPQESRTPGSLAGIRLRTATTGARCVRD
jgi:hypothetical protein